MQVQHMLGTLYAGTGRSYIINEWHVTEIELVLLLVVLLELSCVVVLTFLRYMCSHVSLLLGLRTDTRRTGQTLVHGAFTR